MDFLTNFFLYFDLNHFQSDNNSTEREQSVRKILDLILRKLMSLIKIIKRSGPSTDPCGTPILIGSFLE